MNRLIVGTELLGGIDWGEYSIESVKEAIQVSLDRGIKCFDTAHIYGLGQSEKILSEILSEKRHDVEIITKVGLSYYASQKGRKNIYKDLSYENILKQTVKSIKNLRVDNIPVLLAHWPDEKIDTNNVMLNLKKLKNLGYAKKIGLSNFDIEQVCNLPSSLLPDYYQGPLNLLDLSQITLYESLIKLGVKVITYSPLAQGMLTGKYNRKSKFLDNDRRFRSSHFQENLNLSLKKLEFIKNASTNEGISLTSYAINSLLKINKEIKIIIGIKNKAQLIEIINNISLDIDDENLKKLIRKLA